VTHSQLGRVIFWMTGALVSFCAMALAIRALADTLSVAEILTIRSASGAFILTALVAARPGLRQATALHRMGLHVIRNSVHFAGQYAWALGITLLPLATVFALEFTAPAWVALLAIPMLKERMTASRIGSVVLGFAGVLIVVRPGLEGFQPAVLLVLAAAIAFAITLIMTKQLTATVGTLAILFWMNWMQLPMSFAASDPLFVQRIEAAHIPAVIVVAVAGLASHFCLTNAFRAGDATVGVPFDFLRIPLIALAGWLFYDERLDAFVFAGAAVIITGILWNLRAEARR
jgi:drug/metabolite transporter (DMT)-like permease